MARVLVVDDEEAIQFSFERFLTNAGHDVSWASHESDARAILSVNNFDVAVIDRILSGGFSGNELLKEIKESQPFCKVIMMLRFPVFDSLSDAAEDKPFAYLNDFQIPLPITPDK